MTVARYIVIVDREVGESDGGGLYHDGTAAGAVTQLTRELQEAWDSGAVDGFFRVVGRTIEPSFDTADAVWGPMTDEPGAPLPVQHPHRTWRWETLYGADDDWFMPCQLCGARLGVGVMAWVLDDAGGNGEFARCETHGNPNTPRKPTEHPLDPAVIALNDLIIAVTKGGLELPEGVWNAVKEADYLVNSARDALVDTARRIDDPECRACPDALPHPPHVYPCADGWWENDENWVEGTEHPPAATHWFYTVGDRWDAVRGETEADWFDEGSDHGSTSPAWPTPRTYPINEPPRFGTLQWRDVTGADHSKWQGRRP